MQVVVSEVFSHSVLFCCGQLGVTICREKIFSDELDVTHFCFAYLLRCCWAFQYVIYFVSCKFNWRLSSPGVLFSAYCKNMIGTHYVIERFCEVGLNEARLCTFPSPEALILRLKMLLMSGSGHSKKFKFFHWLTKDECMAEIKNTKYYAFHFLSGQDFAGEQPPAGKPS